MSQSTTGHTDERGGMDGLTDSERHRLLANDRRRLTLEVLSGRTTALELEELAAAVAARAESLDGGEDAIARAKVALHHQHLPLMADLGVLNYDPTLRQIRP